MPEWLQSRAMVPSGAWIRLSRERWQHIKRRHPEMAGYGPEILETLANPDVILEGDGGAHMALRRLATGPHARKSLVVVYRVLADNEGFVVTAYVARRLREGRRILWQV